MTVEGIQANIEDMKAEIKNVMIDLKAELHPGLSRGNLENQIFEIFHHMSENPSDDCLPRALNMFAGLILFLTAEDLVRLQSNNRNAGREKYNLMVTLNNGF